MSADVRKEANRNRTRDFVKFIQDSTADQLGSFVAFEYDGWLVIASWDGSAFNDRLRDLIALERGKPQTIPPKDPA